MDSGLKCIGRHVCLINLGTGSSLKVTCSLVRIITGIGRLGVLTAPDTLVCQKKLKILGYPPPVGDKGRFTPL